MTGSDHDRAEILAAEQRRQSALKSVDMETLNELFSEDLIHVHSNAMVHNKHELLAYIELKRAFVDIERGTLNVMVCGDCAVLSGPMTSQMRTPDSVVRLTGWVTQVLRREDGRWRFVNFQLTVEKIG